MKTLIPRLSRDQRVPRTIMRRQRVGHSWTLLDGRAAGLYFAFSDSNEAMSMEKRYFTSDFSSRS